MKTIQRVENETKLATEKLEAKDYSKALAHIEIALTLAPYSVQLKVLRPKALLGLKKYQEVINLMGEVLRSDPNNPDALYLRGMAMYYSNNIAGAQKHLSNALKLDPDNSTYRKEYKVRSLLDDFC
jgi:DnaJ family protein C protein 7